MPDGWKPFRPRLQDLDRIAGEVASIPRIQTQLLTHHPELVSPDRGAHQYQIAGSRVTLEIGPALPAELEGVGLFVPGSSHHGIARLSTGLGYPHLETDPDFLGLMAAFRTEAGQRVDFLAINDPTSPTDNHRDFITVLEATAASAGAEAPFGGKAGELDLLDLVAAQTKFAAALVRAMGIKHGLKALGHIVEQTFTTARSSTAYQTYWTGVVEVSGTAGKVVFVPDRDDNALRDLRPGEHHLTEEWRARQAAGEIVFQIHWLPFISQQETPTDQLTEAWVERRQPIGRLRFPQSEPDSEEAWLWAALAAEMGANPGHWVRDRGARIKHPGTPFGVARQLAYQLSQQGRDVLPEAAYQEVFASGQISEVLAAELRRRRAAKQTAGHVDSAPSGANPA